MIPQVGRVRARALYSGGVRAPADIQSYTLERLVSMIPERAIAAHVLDWVKKHSPTDSSTGVQQSTLV